MRPVTSSPAAGGRPRRAPLDDANDVLLQHPTQGVGAWTLDATGELVGFLPIATGDLGGWRVNGK